MHFPWFKRKPEKPLEPLKAGTCQCSHERCFHKDGIGECVVTYPPNEEYLYGAYCPCTIFVLDDDSDGNEEPPIPVDPELEELKKLIR